MCQCHNVSEMLTTCRTCDVTCQLAREGLEGVPILSQMARMNSVHEKNELECHSFFFPCTTQSLSLLPSPSPWSDAPNFCVLCCLYSASCGFTDHKQVIAGLIIGARTCPEFCLPQLVLGILSRAISKNTNLITGLNLLFSLCLDFSSCSILREGLFFSVSPSQPSRGQAIQYLESVFSPTPVAVHLPLFSPFFHDKLFP